MRVLFKDESFIAVDKPAGIHVHPPEGFRTPIPPEENGLSLVRDLAGAYVYPVHRLDRATSGVLLYALTEESARRLGRQFQTGLVAKTYMAIARGWVREPLVIDRALGLEGGGTGHAKTLVEPLTHYEIPQAVGQHQTARYTLLRAKPQTGRFHQIRRHLAGIAHPIVGDREHGDKAHNRFWAEQLGVPGMRLRATELEFVHPLSGIRQCLEVGLDQSWQDILSKLTQFEIIFK